MNKDEERYAELAYKSDFTQLDENEQKEMKNLQKVLGLETCDQCKGQGFFTNPSILGYGLEEGDCTKCKGAGVLNLSENLKKELCEGPCTCEDEDNQFFHDHGCCEHCFY